MAWKKKTKIKNSRSNDEKSGLLPVHFFRLPGLFPCIPSLQLKFSSQNSANHTFLLLLESERLRKYRSNAVRGEKKIGKKG